MNITLSARTVYRMRAAGADERGVTISVVVDLNQVGADVDDLADKLRQALLDAVPGAEASFVDKLELVETALHAPDVEYFQKLRNDEPDDQNGEQEEGPDDRRPGDLP